MGMKFVTRLLAAQCCIIALSVPAHAQLSGYYPFSSDAVSLNNDDFARMIEAANKLLRQSPLPVGTATNWRNDQTGSSGTIRVTKTFRHQAMLCHKLVYETIPAATPPANKTTLDWCDTGRGEWKILSS
jgi:surface antigen